MPTIPKGPTEGQARELVPAGWHKCKIAKIMEKTTRAGDEMWGLALEVVDDGPSKGRWVWDNLVFSSQGYTRLRMVASRFGIDLTEGGELTTDMLFGKAANVNVQVEDYVRKDGTAGTKNTVPFEGYEYLESPTPATEEPEEAPF